MSEKYYNENGFDHISFLGEQLLLGERKMGV